MEQSTYNHGTIKIVRINGKWDGTTFVPDTEEGKELIRKMIDDRNKRMMDAEIMISNIT